MMFRIFIIYLLLNLCSCNRNYIVYNVDEKFNGLICVIYSNNGTNNNLRNYYIKGGENIVILDKNRLVSGAVKIEFIVRNEKKVELYRIGCCDIVNENLKRVNFYNNCSVSLIKNKNKSTDYTLISICDSTKSEPSDLEVSKFKEKIHAVIDGLEN
jgi:hypothetical protein